MTNLTKPDLATFLPRLDHIGKAVFLRNKPTKSLRFNNDARL
jgi:hypothetical protein